MILVAASVCLRCRARCLGKYPWGGARAVCDAQSRPVLLARTTIDATKLEHLLMCAYVAMEEEVRCSLVSVGPGAPEGNRASGAAESARARQRTGRPFFLPPQFVVRCVPSFPIYANRVRTCVQMAQIDRCCLHVVGRRLLCSGCCTWSFRSAEEHALHRSRIIW